MILQVNIGTVVRLTLDGRILSGWKVSPSGAPTSAYSLKWQSQSPARVVMLVTV